jgi:hypothetical protein
MRALRPTILSAAARHNRPELSGMSDSEFAVVIATIIYNENFGWLEDDVAPLRPFTPLYQDLQRWANRSALGGNFSVWPANLRPSVALEILRQELPLADQRTVHIPVQVAGSRIRPERFASRDALYAAITAEISRDDLAVAYLAANLERGVYRAALEGVPVNWRALAAWHNQGIVDPLRYRANPTSRDYVRRASAYLGVARELIAERRTTDDRRPTDRQMTRTDALRTGDWELGTGNWGPRTAACYDGTRLPIWACTRAISSFGVTWG